MKRHENTVLLSLVLLLVAFPLCLVRRPQTASQGADIFTGADAQAKDVVAILAPAYKPWAEPLMKPPSGEVESLLFALQAALGAGFIGYYFGVRRERARKPGEAPRC